jgi:peptide-methionine (S)-S-oxide reductase
VLNDKLSLPDEGHALAGREQAFELENKHFVHGRPIYEPFSDISGSSAQQVVQAGDLQKIVLGLGCFWGAERKFWNTEGVYTTAVGYTSGYTPNPTYQEVCSGRTGHNEVVLVVFQPSQVSLEALLTVFFESHNPTQGMRQGNDRGTQYRSGIYCFNQEQVDRANGVLVQYQQALSTAGLGEITTEVSPINEFYYAEQYHQQYLAKNPAGYCGLSGTGVTCAI